MPEEINRILIDQIADLYFVTEESAIRDLRREGIAEEKIHLVGNVMIGTLVHLLPLAAARPIASALDLVEPGSTERICKPYVLLTIHRPANVDDPSRLAVIASALEELSREVDVVFHVHLTRRSQIVKSILVRIAEEYRVVSATQLALEYHSNIEDSES